MDTLQRKKIALENSLRANGNANPSYFSVTQVSHDWTRLRYLLLGFLMSTFKHSLSSVALGSQKLSRLTCVIMVYS